MSTKKDEKDDLNSVIDANNIAAVADYKDSKYHHNHSPESMHEINPETIERMSKKIFSELGESVNQKLFAKMDKMFEIEDNNPGIKNDAKFMKNFNKITEDQIDNVCGMYVATYQLFLTLEEYMRYVHKTDDEELEMWKSMGKDNFDSMKGQFVE